MSFTCVEKYNNSKTLKRIDFRKVGDVEFFAPPQNPTFNILYNKAKNEGKKRCGEVRNFFAEKSEKDSKISPKL